MSNPLDHRRQILQAFGERAWLPVEALHAALFNVERIGGRRVTPLTGSQRASLSRTLKRMETAGLITRPDRRWAWWITDAGCAEAERLTNVANGTQSLTGADR